MAIEKEKSVIDLKEELEKKELINKISKIDKYIDKGKILITISSVGAFVLVTLLFFYLLSLGNKSDNNIPAVLSLLAGSFASFLIMAVGGIIKEFSIKSGLIEVTSKLQEKIENVQTDIGQSKREIEEKIVFLNQNLNQSIQSIDNKITNTNRTGDNKFYNNYKPSAEQLDYVAKAVVKQIVEVEELNKRNVDKLLKDVQPIGHVVMEKSVSG